MTTAPDPHRLLSYQQCRARLDPDGTLGITLVWLRRQMGYVKVGKKHLVPEAEFTALCNRMMDECRGNQPRRASCGVQIFPPGSSDGAKPDENAKRLLAERVAERLKRSSKNGRQTALPAPSGNVVALDSPSTKR